MPVSRSCGSAAAGRSRGACPPLLWPRSHHRWQTSMQLRECLPPSCVDIKPLPYGTAKTQVGLAQRRDCADRGDAGESVADRRAAAFRALRARPSRDPAFVMRSSSGALRLPRARAWRPGRRAGVDGRGHAVHRQRKRPGGGAMCTSVTRRGLENVLSVDRSSRDIMLRPCRIFTLWMSIEHARPDILGQPGPEMAFDRRSRQRLVADACSRPSSRRRRPERQGDRYVLRPSNRKRPARAAAASPFTR